MAYPNGENPGTVTTIKNISELQAKQNQVIKSTFRTIKVNDKEICIHKHISNVKIRINNLVTCLFALKHIGIKYIGWLKVKI